MNSQEQKKLENKVIEKLNKYIPANETVIAAISGGPDSIFLLYLLKKLKEKKSLNIIVAHLNHKLRGKESDQDELFIKSEAEKLELQFYSKKIDINAISKKNKTGIEESGRKERYKFFNQLTKKHKASHIITAHHADDNIETIILNLVRGCGLEGLAGMRELDENLLRPLLDFSKTQILDYLKSKKIAFKTEKSNLDTIYRRNYIRHKIIPELKNLNPNLAETLAKNNQNIREINEELNLKAQNWISHNTLNKTQTKFDAKAFTKETEAMQKIILRKIYKNIIGNTQNIESTHINECLKLIQQNIGQKRKKLGKLILSIKSNIIHLEKNPKKVQY